MPKIADLRAQGISDTANHPGGRGVLKATNVVLDEEGKWRCRRGFEPLAVSGTDAGAAQAMTFYKGTLVYIEGNQLYSWNDTTGRTLIEAIDSRTLIESLGNVEAPDGEATRFAEAGGSLFMTTTTGIKKLDSLTGKVRQAGMPWQVTEVGSEIDGTALTSTYGDAPTDAIYLESTGELRANYRFSLSRIDANNVEVSGPALFKLPVTVSDYGFLYLTVTLPPGTIAGDILNVWRTPVVTTDIEPGDDYRLAIKHTISATEITAGLVTVLDIAHRERSGPSAPFNESAGGLANSAYAPPHAKDIALYKDHMFFANTISQHRLTLRLLGAAGVMGWNTDDLLTIDGVTPDAAIVGAAEPASLSYTERYIHNWIAEFNDQSDGIKAFQASGGEDPTGYILVEEVLCNSDAAFTASMSADTTDALPLANLSRLGTTITAIISGDQTARYQTGGWVVLAGGTDTDFPAGKYRLTSASYSVPNTTLTFEDEARTDGVANVGADYTVSRYYGPYFEPALTPGVTVTSKNNSGTNKLFISNFQKYENVPPSQYLLVGPSTNVILRVVPQSDALVVFTSQGIFAVVGDSLSTFRVIPVDATCILQAPSSATTLDGRVIAWTSKGVGWITAANGFTPVNAENGIDNKLRKHFTDAGATLIKSRTWAISYESDWRYILRVPTGASTYAMYVFNAKSGEWTEWDRTTATCAAVDPTNDRLYLGDSTSGIKRERKARTTADFQDATGVGIPVSIRWAVQTGDDASVAKMWQEFSLFMAEGSSTPASTVTWATEYGTYDQTTAISAKSTGLLADLSLTLPETKRRLVPRGVKRSTYMILTWACTVLAADAVIGGMALRYRVLTGQNKKD